LDHLLLLRTPHEHRTDPRRDPGARLGTR
jgi:hypothetical protein